MKDVKQVYAHSPAKITGGLCRDGEMTEKILATLLWLVPTKNSYLLFSTQQVYTVLLKIVEAML